MSLNSSHCTFKSLPCCFVAVSLVVGAFWFISVVAVVDDVVNNYVLVDFVVAAVSVSSPYNQLRVIKD